MPVTVPGAGGPGVCTAGATGHDGCVSDDKDTQETEQSDVDLPQAAVDPNVDRAPGGADASSSESDVGSGDRTDGEVVTPDPPLSAQQDGADVPDPIREPEDKEQANDDGVNEAADENPD